MSIIHLLKMRRRVAPVTFYEKLAQDGLLEDYLASFLEERFDTDEDFRNEMIDVILQYSKKPVPKLERFYLEKIIESLSYFLEYTSQWTKKQP